MWIRIAPSPCGNKCNQIFTLIFTVKKSDFYSKKSDFYNKKSDFYSNKSDFYNEKIRFLE